MPGFFPVDVDDFVERMSDKSMASPFHVSCILRLHTWRRHFHTQKTIGGIEVDLGPGQMIYRESQLAREYGYRRSTFRSLVDKLIEMGEVTIKNVTPSIKVLTVVRTYRYNEVFGRIINTGEQDPDSPSTADGQADTAVVTTDLDNALHNTVLQGSYTNRLIDYQTDRLIDGNTDKLVENKPIREKEIEVDPEKGIHQVDGHPISEKEIQDVVDGILRERSDIRPEMARIMALQRLSTENDGNILIVKDDADDRIVDTGEEDVS